MKPVPISIARRIIEAHHYLHSLPAGTRVAFGVLLGTRLLGALTLGVGPKQAHSLVEGATPDDCLTLTRLWLSDLLPPNSESRVLGVVLRALHRHTNLKFLISYADPAQGHVGTIYQATGWVYTGLSEPMPLYDLGDGIARHSRSLSHAFGTHSLTHFKRHGISVKLVHRAAKHRYIYFLDPSWRERLTVEELPYPKKGGLNESS
ncbi:MAG: DNA methyltransferase [Dehalococcoidia bacterium]